MVAYLRFLVRSVPVNGGLNTHKPTVAAIARSVFHRYPKTWSCPGQRSLHSDRAPNAAPTNQAPIEQTFTIDLPRPRVALDSDWRHPRFGFAAADLSHLIYMKLPQAVTEKDVKVLIAKAGLQTAQIFMYYSFETGRPGKFCFLKIADKNKVDTAITSLSRFTLLDQALEPCEFNIRKAPLEYPPLLAGWLPSPSSDLSARVIRPPKTEPPKLLATLMQEQWVEFGKLPKIAAAQDKLPQVAEAFYQRFHEFDVVGITRPKASPKKGLRCKILFGNQSDAKRARALHVNTKFMGKPGEAKTYRLGAEYKKALLNYRRSLPEDLDEEEIRDLLEEEFTKIYPTPAGVQRWKDYPTPDSAVGLKDS